MADTAERTGDAKPAAGDKPADDRVARTKPKPPPGDGIHWTIKSL